MPSFHKRYQKAKAWVDKMLGQTLFALFVAFLSFVAAVKLDFYNPLQENQFDYMAFYMAFIVALIFILSEYIAGLYERLSDGLAKEAAKVEQVGEELGRMQNRVVELTEAVKDGGKLLNLDGVIEDLELRLKNLRPGETLEIEHLGLDMTAAWEMMCKRLEESADVARVHYHLLILGENKRNIELPRAVASWLGPARDKKTEIEEALEEMRAGAVQPRPDGSAATGSLTSEVRTYCEVPVVHGILVRKPFRAAYVAISRWSGRNYKDYYWGGKQYHRVVDPISKADQDLMDILDGHFHRWWNANPPPRTTPARTKRAAEKRAGRIKGRRSGPRRAAPA